jgi:hypothetical protein
VLGFRCRVPGVNLVFAGARCEARLTLNPAPGTRHLTPSIGTQHVYIAGRCLAFKPPWRLQPSEQNNRVVAPPPIARVAGTQVPHTSHRTNFSCACGLRPGVARGPAIPDRSCCNAWINFCAMRRYGNKRRNRSANRRATIAAKIRYFKSSPELLRREVSLSRRRIDGRQTAWRFQGVRLIAAALVFCSRV